MSNEEEQYQSFYEEVERFVSLLDRLQKNENLPPEWKKILLNKISDVCNVSRGRKPDKKNIERDISIAIKMFKFRLNLPNEKENITNYAEDLAIDFGIDRRNIFTAEEKYKAEAIARIIDENLEEPD